MNGFLDVLPVTNIRNFENLMVFYLISLNNFHFVYSVILKIKSDKVLNEKDFAIFNLVIKAGLTILTSSN